MSSDGGAAGDDPVGRGRPSFMATESAEFGRGISFFDAIYGFAVTLLVANVDAPPPEAWKSLGTLAASGVPSQLLGLSLSFVVIAVFWRLNVRLTRLLTGMDGVTTFMNLVAVGLVILIPFTTQGMSDPDSSRLALPTAIYAVNIALVAIAQISMFQVARARGLEKIPSDARENAWRLTDALLTPAVFLLSVPIALVFGAEVAKWSWASMFVLGPISGRLLIRATRRREAAR